MYTVIITEKHIMHLQFSGKLSNKLADYTSISIKTCGENVAC